MGMSIHALSLALLLRVRCFDTNVQSWLDLPISYDLKIVEVELKGGMEKEAGKEGGVVYFC